MRPTARRAWAWDALAVTSLLLCAAAAASWAASYRAPHSLPLTRADRERRLVANGGALQLWHTRRLDVTADTEGGDFTVEQVPLNFPGGVYHPIDRRTWWPVRLAHTSWSPVASARVMRGTGVEDRAGRGMDVGIEAQVWAVPHWLVVVLLVLAAVAPLRRGLLARRRRRRSSRGLCPHCGYDLRATPGRCPECGGSAGRDVVVRRFVRR